RPGPAAAQGVSRGGLPVRLRVLGVRKLRERLGGEERPRADAEAEGEAARRPCRDGRRLRQRQTLVPRAQFVGRGLGDARLLHDAVQLLVRLKPQRRLLDHHARRLTWYTSGFLPVWWA